MPKSDPAFHKKAQRWELSKARYFRFIGKPENEAMCIAIAKNHEEAAKAALSQTWRKLCDSKRNQP
jgi:hypothetical protein